MSKSQEMLDQVEAILEDLVKSLSEKPAVEEKNDEVKKSDPAMEAPECASDPQDLNDIKTGTETDISANGGDDVIKNKDSKDKDSEKMNKEEDEEEEDEEEEKSKKVKKSLSDDEVAISKEDFELLKKAKAEEEAKKAEELKKSDPLFKSVEGLVEMVKSLREDIDTIKKTPAREPKSLAGYKPIEKGGESTASESPAVVKAKVLNVLSSLLEKGQCTSDDVCEYEQFRQVSNPEVRNLIKEALKV